MGRKAKAAQEHGDGDAGGQPTPRGGKKGDKVKLDDDAGGQPTPRGGKKGDKAKPGKLGFAGVEDDGAAQSKFKGLSSGARASLRKRLEAERTSGEQEPAFEAPPAAPTPFVDCLFFASEVFSRKDDVTEAAQALASARSADLPHSSKGSGGSPPIAGGIMGAFASLGGPLCECTIAAYSSLAEMDACAGDLRYRAWEQHGPQHTAIGLDADGVAVIGAAAERAAAATAAAAATDEAKNDPSEHTEADDDNGPLDTIIEVWDAPDVSVVAAGPFSLDYTPSTGLADDDAAKLRQLRGVARLLKEALARRLPVILSCRGGDAAESDLARLVLAALASAPPPKSPLPAPQPWEACTPIICYDAGGLWERLHMKRPYCAYLMLDGAITFSKAPRALRNAAFDVPLERVLLCSSAPRHLPALESSEHSHSRRSLCHSGHIIHTAERVAEMRRTAAADDASAPSATSILEHARENARLLFPSLGLQWLDDQSGVSSEAERYRHYFWGSESALPPERLRGNGSTAQDQEAGGESVSLD